MIYIVTSTTTNVPNVSTGPILGVHGSLREANAHMSVCIEAAALGGELRWDLKRPDESTEKRCAMIARADGGSTVIAIEGWDIRRAKRVEKAAASNEVLTEALDAIMDKNEE